MPSTSLQWIALFGFAAIVALFLTELRRWRLLGSVIGRRQRVLRVCLIVLVEALFAMMYFGSWATDRGNPLAELLYWTLCLFGGLAVVGLALADVREVMRSYARMCRQTFSDIDRGDPREK